MVVATWVWKIRKATKLKKAAHATAQCGLSTRVLTMVAMEFAASWKPLTKSKASARPTMPQTTESRILQDDRIEHVGHVLAAVGRGLDLLVDVLPLDDLDRVVVPLEELRQRLLHQAVRVVLLRLDRDALLVDRAPVLHVAQQREGLHDQARRVPQAVRQLAHLVRR